MNRKGGLHEFICSVRSLLPGDNCKRGSTDFAVHAFKEKTICGLFVRVLAENSHFHINLEILEEPFQLRLFVEVLVGEYVNESHRDSCECVGFLKHVLDTRTGKLGWSNEDFTTVRAFHAQLAVARCHCASLVMQDGCFRDEMISEGFARVQCRARLHRDEENTT